MADSTKRQAFVAFTVLFLLLGIIVYFLCWVKPVVKIVPVNQALQSVEAEKRSKELEAKLLKSVEAQPSPQPDSGKK